MYYGIGIKLDTDTGSFVNLLDRYGLILCADVSDGAPPVRTEVFTIAGTNGTVDISEILTGSPLYNNRTLSFSLCMAQTEEQHFMHVYKAVKDAYHGHVCKIVMPWDTNRYYIGRVSIGDKGAYGSSQFNVTVDAKPYLYSVIDDTEAGL